MEEGVIGSHDGGNACRGRLFCRISYVACTRRWMLDTIMRVCFFSLQRHTQNAIMRFYCALEQKLLPSTFQITKQPLHPLEKEEAVPFSEYAPTLLAPPPAKSGTNTTSHAYHPRDRIPAPPAHYARCPTANAVREL